MTSPIAGPGARWSADELRKWARVFEIDANRFGLPREDTHWYAKLCDAHRAHASAIEALQRGAAPEEVLAMLTGERT